MGYLIRLFKWNLEFSPNGQSIISPVDYPFLSISSFRELNHQFENLKHVLCQFFRPYLGVQRGQGGVGQALPLTVLGITLESLDTQPPSKTKWQGPSLDFLPLTKGPRQETGEGRQGTEGRDLHPW